MLSMTTGKPPAQLHPKVGTFRLLAYLKAFGTSRYSNTTDGRSDEHASIFKMPLYAFNFPPHFAAGNDAGDLFSFL